MSNEKRKVGNYEVIACQRIGGEEIIVAEDKNAVPSERYLCCYVERNELMELYTHGLASDGYAEIFEIYGQRITTAAKNAIEKTDEEKAVIGGGKKQRIEKSAGFLRGGSDFFPEHKGLLHGTSENFPRPCLIGIV